MDITHNYEMKNKNLLTKKFQNLICYKNSDMCITVSYFYEKLFESNLSLLKILTI